MIPSNDAITGSNLSTQLSSLEKTDATHTPPTSHTRSSEHSVFRYMQGGGNSTVVSPSIFSATQSTHAGTPLTGGMNAEGPGLLEIMGKKEQVPGFEAARSGDAPHRQGPPGRAPGSHAEKHRKREGYWHVLKAAALLVRNPEQTRKNLRETLQGWGFTTKTARAYAVSSTSRVLFGLTEAARRKLMTWAASPAPASENQFFGQLCNVLKDERVNRATWNALRATFREYHRRHGAYPPDTATYKQIKDCIPQEAKAMRAVYVPLCMGPGYAEWLNQDDAARAGIQPPPAPVTEPKPCPKDLVENCVDFLKNNPGITPRGLDKKLLKSGSAQEDLRGHRKQVLAKVVAGLSAETREAILADILQAVKNEKAGSTPTPSRERAIISKRYGSSDLINPLVIKWIYDIVDTAVANADLQEISADQIMAKLPPHGGSWTRVVMHMLTQDAGEVAVLDDLRAPGEESDEETDESLPPASTKRQKSHPATA